MSTTPQTTVLFSMESKNVLVGSKSTPLLCFFVFRFFLNWFRMKEKIEPIDKFKNYLSCFFFQLTVLALLLTVVLSVLFIMSGMYGELEQIGVTFCLLISLQVYYNIYHIKMIWLQVTIFKCQTFYEHFFSKTFVCTIKLVCK